MREQLNKPVIETIINTAALTLTAWGVTEITMHEHYFGFVVISFGMVLEFSKYWGRKNDLW